MKNIFLIVVLLALVGCNSEEGGGEEETSGGGSPTPTEPVDPTATPVPTVPPIPDVLEIPSAWNEDDIFGTQSAQRASNAACARSIQLSPLVSVLEGGLPEQEIANFVGQMLPYVIYGGNYDFAYLLYGDPLFISENILLSVLYENENKRFNFQSVIEGQIGYDVYSSFSQSLTFAQMLFDQMVALNVGASFIELFFEGNNQTCMMRLDKMNITANDTDGDGITNAEDCAPDNPTKWELKNYYLDTDGDGYGMDLSAYQVCAGAGQPSFSVDVGGDCDDFNPSTHPGADEINGDGIDNDCNGEIDEGGVEVPGEPIISGNNWTYPEDFTLSSYEGSWQGKNIFVQGNLVIDSLNSGDMTNCTLTSTGDITIQNSSGLDLTDCQIFAGGNIYITANTNLPLTSVSFTAGQVNFLGNEDYSMEDIAITNTSKVYFADNVAFEFHNFTIQAAEVETFNNIGLGFNSCSMIIGDYLSHQDGEVHFTVCDLTWNQGEINDGSFVLFSLTNFSSQNDIDVNEAVVDIWQSQMGDVNMNMTGWTDLYITDSVAQATVSLDSFVSVLNGAATINLDREGADPGLFPTTPATGITWGISPPQTPYWVDVQNSDLILNFLD